MIKLSLRQVDCYSFIGKLLTWVFLLQSYCVLLVMSHWNILECSKKTGGVDWLLSISLSDTDSSEDRGTVRTSIDKLSCWEVWLQSSNRTVSFSSSGIRSVVRKLPGMYPSQFESTVVYHGCIKVGGYPWKTQKLLCVQLTCCSSALNHIIHQFLNGPRWSVVDGLKWTLLKS